MVKSKYLILNSFYFNFDDNLTEIKKVKESFKKQTMLDLSRFDELKYIIHFTFEKLKNINFVYLPKNIEKIYDSAFRENNIKFLDLSNCINLKVIDVNAFENNQIKRFKLSQNVETMLASVFRYNKIETLDLSKYVNINFIHCHAFRENQIKYFKLPKDIKWIDEWAFENNQIQTLDFSNYMNLKIIYHDAFSNNPLNEIKILDDIMIEYNNEYKDDLWNKFTKYYNENNKKAGDYIYINNKWQWYPL